MIRRFRSKLTLLFSGLFGAIILVVATAAYFALVSTAQESVEQGLVSNADVYERIWELREQQMWDNASLLAKDFGFRASIMDGDEATISSALGNLKDRMEIDVAFVLMLDGAIYGQDDQAETTVPPALMEELQNAGSAKGLFEVQEVIHQAVALPINAPSLVGWAVFAKRIDQAELESVQELSSIGLTIAILTRQQDSTWTARASSNQDNRMWASSELANLNDTKARQVNLDHINTMMLARPLQTIGSQFEARLALSFPVAAEMAKYQTLLGVVSLIGAIGLAAVILGCWGLAKTVTKPVAALRTAAQELAQGARKPVHVQTQDEFKDLADSFNHMIEEISAREEKISFLALNDRDTGLHNRLWISQQLETADNTGKPLALFALGIGRLLDLRSAVGHEHFNELLGILGTRLSLFDANLGVAQLSSTNLGVLAQCAPEAIEGMAAALLGIVAQPVTLGGQQVDVQASVGIAHTRADADCVESLVERALVGLNQGISLRKEIHCFDAELYGDPRSNLSIMGDMRAAMDAGTIFLAFQPKYCLRSRRVVGVEALVRWIDEERGFVNPETFVGMAEETGHIRALTDYVMDRAIAAQATMSEAGYDVTMSINVSGMLIDDDGFVAHALDAASSAVGVLNFEITETAVINNPDIALKMINRLRDAGIEIGIDDYGTGMSSLSYLKQIPATELKIDKAFVLNLAKEKRDALLVKSTVDLAHSMNMKITAEGVEDELSIQLLTSFGCDIAQGYAIARPMPLTDCLEFLCTSPWNNPEIADDAVSREAVGG